MKSQTVQYTLRCLYNTQLVFKNKMTLKNKDKPASLRKRFKKYSKDVCSVKTVQKRVPIVKWLPEYDTAKLIQDIIAGLTVGLTAIPQGIAYAVVAGLSPEYGLYAGLTGGFVYLIFGSCKDITVGPTAVISALVSKYVAKYSPDFAVLAAFLSGIIELVMGILHLGFLVDFISQPVISGFTTAAAIQISASQLKSLFGTAGSSGNYFVESIQNFVKNINTVRLWDPILGFITIVILILLKKLGDGCKRTDGAAKQLRWFISLARNAVVVFFGIAVAYVIKIITNQEPLTLIGEIGSGLPSIQAPPFSTVVGNETYNFQDMLQALGPQSIVLPLVAILESVAIAKAFSGGTPIDATQEMMALGLCNIVGSFISSMPTTGSFTRTTLNYASGVQTPAGGIVTGLLVFLALSLLTSTFYYIPKASLGGLILMAMVSMVDYSIFGKLWRSSKRELFVLFITVIVSLLTGLEYGVVVGVVVEALMMMFINSKPAIVLGSLKNENRQLVIVELPRTMFYCAAGNVRRKIIKASEDALENSVIMIDGKHLKHIDTTVASNILSVVRDLEKKDFKFVFANFKVNAKEMCLNLYPEFEDKFETTSIEFK